MRQGTLRIKTSPLAFLIGVVVKNAVPYVSETYLKEEEKEVGAYLERLKRVKEEKKQQLELEEAIAFEKWFESQSEEDLVKYVEPSEIAPVGSTLYRQVVKAWFIENQQGQQEKSDQTSIT